MQIRAEQLEQHLKKQFQPVYIVSGEDPLLMQESCDLIRKYAREQGCTDREVIEVTPKNFSWSEIFNSAASMSLFADRKLIELRLPSGKPGAEGSKALCEYLDSSGLEDVLLIVSGKIDKQSTSSKWYKALDQAGGCIQIWPVDANSLPRWLEQRVQAAGMTIDREAVQLLCERVEGNLLSAVQEIEKLKLLASNNSIDADTVVRSVADNTRFNLFALADNAMAGDTANSLRMLYGLRGEGTEAITVLWALSREVTTLYQLQAESEAGGNLQQAMRSKRIWNSKMPMVQAALSRHSKASLTQLLDLAATTDGSIKGFADGNPWDHLADLIAGLGGNGKSQTPRIRA
jgi:DNA polymerase III subunit delta